MAITLDPKNTKAVIFAQKNWLKVLQRAQPNKLSPILIKAIEGKWEEGEDFDLYGWKPSVNIWHKLEVPIYTRWILPNEILIDPDTPEWSAMKAGIEKLYTCCKENRIPYLIGFSGGKGIHVSILFDNIKLDDDVVKDLEKVDIDVYKTVRRALVNALAEKAGVDLEAIRVDWGKINFNCESKGSQVRDFGTTRGAGLYKTLIEDIPDHKPEPFGLPLVFPENVELWNIEGTEFKEIVINALKAEVDRAKKAKEFAVTGVDLTAVELLAFPCIKRLHEAGLTSGRYYAGVSAALLCKKLSLSKETTEQNMQTFYKTVKGLSDAETALYISNGLEIYYSENHFSCRTLKETYPALKLCDFQNCPLE